MDFYGVFSFLIILKEAFQLLPKNGKLMALVALFSVLISVITFIAFGFSVLGLAQDIASVATSFVPDPSSFNPSDPSSFTSSLSDPSRLQDQIDHMKRILAILCAVEIAFVVIFYIISFITTMATILISACDTLSTKDLVSRIARTWTKPFVTSMYVAIQALGLFGILGIFAAPAVIYPNIPTILIAILVAVVAFLFYLYLMVVWTLAIVVSVVEQGCYGMVAIGKASELVKGHKLKGYMLNLFFFLLSLIMVVIYHVIFLINGPLSAIIYGLFMVGISYFAKILQVVAYTVFYFHCKKQHGERPEIDIGVAKYELLPTTNPAKC